MIEELKAYFQDFLEQKLKKINLRIEDLYKQFFENKKEQEIMLFSQSERMIANYYRLENEFQSLLKEINKAQKQADEIIEKAYQKITTTQTTQKYPLFNQSDFPQNILSKYQSNIKTKDINNNNYKDDYQRPADQNTKLFGTSTPIIPKGSNLEEVFATKTGKKYHMANCDSLSSSKIPITIREALKKGLIACRICIG